MVEFFVGLVLGFFVAYLVLALLTTAREDNFDDNNRSDM